ncbi:Hypothetical predicted protein, partial [Mytilus galloprovincialis]
NSLYNFYFPLTVIRVIKKPRTPHAGCRLCSTRGGNFEARKKYQDFQICRQQFEDNDSEIDNNYQPTENEDESDESEEVEGESYDTEEPFREWFARIGELRSLCPNASMAALNATSGLIQRRKTIKLCFRAHSEVIFDFPDRENIKISSLYIPNKDILEKSVYLVDRHSKKQKEKTERHIIFCESIAEVSKIYAMFIKQFANNRKLFEMFHSKTNQKGKEKIRNDVTVDGDIRQNGR